MLFKSGLNLHLDKICQNNMYKDNSKSFGQYIKHLRLEKQLPLRKIAIILGIDTSTLSKIEKNERSANEKVISKLSKIFEVDKEELKIKFLSDRITNQLMNEENGIEVLKEAQKKIIRYKNNDKH